MVGGHNCTSCCLHGENRVKQRRGGGCNDFQSELEDLANELLPKILKMPFSADQWHTALNRVCDNYARGRSYSRARPSYRVYEEPSPDRSPPQPDPCTQAYFGPPNYGLPIVWVPKFPADMVKLLNGMPCEVFRDIHQDCTGKDLGSKADDKTSEEKSPKENKAASPKRRPSPKAKPKPRARRRRRRRRRRRLRSRSCRRPTRLECQCKYGVSAPPPLYYEQPRYGLPQNRSGSSNYGPAPAYSRSTTRPKTASATRSTPVPRTPRATKSETAPPTAKPAKKAKSSSSSSSSSSSLAAPAGAAAAGAVPAPPTVTAPADDMFGPGGLFGGGGAPAAAPAPAPGADLDWLTGGTSPAPPATPGGADWLTGGTTPTPAPANDFTFSLFD